MALQRVVCPKCKTPVAVEVEQIFDVDRDPEAKGRILSGMFNIMQCPVCGFVGQVPVPVVYHDSSKELLLVYVPQELGLSQEEQEKAVGPLVQQVMRGLPAERRKAYLLRPQYFLSFRSLVERILEADGITKEMIEAQEKRLSLLQRLLDADDEARKQILENEKDLVDEAFWDLLAYTMEAAEARGDKVLLKRLERIQDLVMEHTPFGQQIKEHRKAVEETYAFIKTLPQNITPEQLVDRLLAWPQADEIHLRYLAQLFFPDLLTYPVFQALREREEHGSVEVREKARQVRETLVRILDKLEEGRKRFEKGFQEVFEKAVEVADNDAELAQAVQALLTFFAVDPAYTTNLLGKVLQKYKPKTPQYERAVKVVDAIEAQLIPPEVRLLQRLLSTDDPAIWKALLRKHAEVVTPVLLNRLAEEFTHMSEADQKRFQPLLDLVAREVMAKQIAEGKKVEPMPQAPAVEAAQAGSQQAPRILKPGEDPDKPQGPSQLILPE